MIQIGLDPSSNGIALEHTIGRKPNEADIIVLILLLME